jgi:hypothetical protein
MMKNPADPAALPAEMRRIREAVERDGAVRVRRDQLHLLQDEIGRTERFLAVAKIAQWEGWAFDFEKDDCVRFSRRML